jgi:protein-tyrosine phosphatase
MRRRGAPPDREEDAMIRIAPDRLWIGHGGEGHDFPPIFAAEIEAVVELAVEEPTFPSRRDMIACRFPLLDGAGNRPELLALAIRTVAGLIAARVPTLVCCGNGMSRSPAVIAAALALIHGEPPERCLERVTRHHPSDVSPGLWQEITRLAPSGFEIVGPPAEQTIVRGRPPT